MHNLAILATFLLLAVTAYGANFTNCNNSHCTPATPCSDVSFVQLVDLNCHYLDRTFQIFEKLFSSTPENRPQLKDVNMRNGTGMHYWPRRIRNVICTGTSATDDGQFTVRTNCHAYRVTDEDYTAIKTRNLTIHDVYEVIAFAAFTGQVIRDKIQDPNVTELLTHLCTGDVNLNNVLGSSSLWTSSSRTNPNSKNNTAVNTNNPFPFQQGSTGMDDNEILEDFHVKLATLFQIQRLSNIMRNVVNFSDLEDCVPLNTDKYIL